MDSSDANLETAGQDLRSLSSMWVSEINASNILEESSFRDVKWGRIGRLTKSLPLLLSNEKTVLLYLKQKLWRQFPFWWAPSACVGLESPEPKEEEPPPLE